MDSATNFFRGVREGALHAAARPLHVGRSFIVVRTDLTDDEGRAVGQTTQTQAVLAPRPRGDQSRRGGRIAWPRRSRCRAAGSCGPGTGGRVGVGAPVATRTPTP